MLVAMNLNFEHFAVDIKFINEMARKLTKVVERMIKISNCRSKKQYTYS